MAVIRGYVPSCNEFYNYEDVTMVCSVVPEDLNKFKSKISSKKFTSVLLKKHCHCIC
jgi:hypothetical protein